jgi:L-alanine-DL-glutamate epimerase-like enolase superfamily enzyme
VHVLVPPVKVLPETKQVARVKIPDEKGSTGWGEIEMCGKPKRLARLPQPPLHHWSDQKSWVRLLALIDSQGKLQD